MNREDIKIVVLMALMAWMVVASSVFAFRHPWATDTERFLYMWQALTFQKVEYSEARPRE